MSRSGEVRRFVRRLQAAGLAVERAGSGHNAVYCDGRRIATFPHSGEGNALKQAERDLRRYHGIEVPR